MHCLDHWHILLSTIDAYVYMFANEILLAIPISLSFVVFAVIKLIALKNFTTPHDEADMHGDRTQ